MFSDSSLGSHAFKRDGGQLGIYSSPVACSNLQKEYAKLFILLSYISFQFFCDNWNILSPKPELFEGVMKVTISPGFVHKGPLIHPGCEDFMAQKLPYLLAQHAALLKLSSTPYPC